METQGFIEGENKGADLSLHFKGQWTISSTFPSLAEITSLFSDTPDKIVSVCFDSNELQAWDSRFLVILNDIKEYAAANNILFAAEGLPSGVQRLLTLASASPGKPSVKPDDTNPSFLETVGNKTSYLIQDGREFVSFTGTITLSYLRLFSGKAQFLKSDFLSFLEECGPAALPIVSLISVLVGVILAF
ncbi:MAG: hypothetical protein N2A40_04440, partial [Desulfobulbaceae bacterium]